MALLPGETRTSDTVEDKYGRPEVVLVDANALPSNEFPDVSGPRDADGRRILAVSGGVPGGGGGDGDVTQPEFDALESRVDVLEGTSDTQQLGVLGIGASWNSLAGNHSYAQRCITAPAGGTLTGFQAYLDGNGINAGVQRVRTVVFADSGTVPTSVVGSSAPFTVTSGDVAGWKDLAGTVVLPGAGNYFLALAVEVGGVSTNNIVRVAYDTAAAGNLVYNTDTGLVGAVAAFGSTTGSLAQQWSLRATYTTAPGIQGLTIQDEGTPQGASASATTLNFVGDTVSVSNSSGLATVTVSAAAVVAASSAVTSMLANFPLPASATFTSDPISMGGKNLSVGALADQTIGTLLISDSTDGTTKRTRAVPAPATQGGNSIASAGLPIIRPYAHVALTNSTTDQGNLELAMTVA